MSSRIDGSFGSLGERTQRSGSPRPRTPWCLVDGSWPGVVAAWTNPGGQWQALVCRVKDSELHSGLLPARPLTPH